MEMVGHIERDRDGVYGVRSRYYLEVEHLCYTGTYDAFPTVM